MKTFLAVFLTAGISFAATNPKSCPFKNKTSPVRMHASTNPEVKKSQKSVAQTQINKKKKTTR
jgi:hypothetical protein